MTATSEKFICNLALTRLGHRIITDLTENSKGAELCALHYPLCRDTVLRAHPWNFAMRRATLFSDTTAVPFEYTYSYPLPVDCLKVLRTRAEAAGDTDCPYRIEGRAIVTNSATLAIEYISRVTDVAQFDALFVDVLAARIAAEIAVALTDNATLAGNMMSSAEAKLREARSIDAQEGTPREVIDTTGWLNSRY